LIYCALLFLSTGCSKAMMMMMMMMTTTIMKIMI